MTMFCSDEYVRFALLSLLYHLLPASTVFYHLLPASTFFYRLNLFLHLVQLTSLAVIGVSLPASAVSKLLVPEMAQ